MKRVFFILTTLLFVFCIAIPSLLADATEERNIIKEPYRSDTPNIITEPSEKEQGKEIFKEEKIVRLNESDEIRDLIAEIKRQREEIEQLRDEVTRLRGLVEGRPEQEKPLIRRGNGNPPRRLEQTQPTREYREPERLEPQREIIEPEEKRPEQVSDIDSEMKALEEKTAMQPYNKDARVKLAEIYRKVGRKEDAIFQYLEVLRIEPIELRIEADLDILKENPNDLDTRIDIANQYKEIGDLDNALRYYEEYMKLKGISRLSEERRSDFNLGEIISYSAEEVVIKTFEGDTATFKVPKLNNKDGSYTSDKEISEKALNLDKGKKVKVIWYEIEGQKVIHDIEILKEQKQNKPEQGQ